MSWCVWGTNRSSSSPLYAGMHVKYIYSFWNQHVNRVHTPIITPSGITRFCTPGVESRHVTPMLDILQCSRQGNAPGSRDDEVPFPNS